VILGLRAFDLTDVYRGRYGYGDEANAVSWAARRAGREFGRRFDHIFGPEALMVRDCGYVQAWREAEPRLSDHAAVWARFDWR
jgi:exonuclease III